MHKLRQLINLTYYRSSWSNSWRTAEPIWWAWTRGTAVVKFCKFFLSYLIYCLAADVWYARDKLWWSPSTCSSERSQSAIPESGGLVLGCGGRIQSGGASQTGTVCHRQLSTSSRRVQRAPPSLPYSCQWRHTQQTAVRPYMVSGNWKHCHAQAHLVAVASTISVFLNTIHLSSFAVHSWLLSMKVVREYYWNDMSLLLCW